MRIKPILQQAPNNDSSILQSQDLLEKESGNYDFHEMPTQTFQQKQKQSYLNKTDAV